MDIFVSFVIPVAVVVIACVMLFVKNEDEDKPPIERLAEKAKARIENRGITLTKRNGVFALGILAVFFIVFQLFFRYTITTTGRYAAYKYDRLTGDIWYVYPGGQRLVKKE